VLEAGYGVRASVVEEVAPATVSKPPQRSHGRNHPPVEPVETTATRTTRMDNPEWLGTGPRNSFEEISESLVDKRFRGVGLSVLAA
jgi:hypothetical protein